MVRVSIIFPAILLLFGCATVPPRVAVVERSGSLPITPDWARPSRPVFEEEETLFFLGYVEIEGRASTSAAMEMSDDNALSGPVRDLVGDYVKQSKIPAELSEEVGKQILSATREVRNHIPNLSISKRYWEVVELSEKTRVPRTLLRAYSLAQAPKSEVERARKDYQIRLPMHAGVQNILREAQAKRGVDSLDTGRR